MSATNHTSNYNLPIYEAGNTANWLVDFNGAMSTIDSALNTNKLAEDTLKTDMEELQTDFQQVITKADAAEQAATLASTNAANALTIANNATTIAGDAQVDSHAALTQIEKLTSSTNIQDSLTFGTQPGEMIQFFVQSASSIGFRCAFHSNINNLTKSLAENFETVSVGNSTILKAKRSFLDDPFENNEFLRTRDVNTLIVITTIYGLKKVSPETQLLPARFSYGLYKHTDKKWYPTINTSTLPNWWTTNGAIACFSIDTTFFNIPLIRPLTLLSSREYINFEDYEYTLFEH